MPSGKYIILRATPFKESDLLIDGLGNDGDRIKLTAKNAIKSRHRFGGGVLEALNFVEFHYTEAKSGFFYIQEAALIYGFGELRDNYKKLENAFYFSQLIAKATGEGMQDNKQLFDLFGNVLKVLETAEDFHLIKLHFHLKFLYYLGILGLDEDTKEFIATPISKYKQIHLTNDEQSHLMQYAQIRLKEIDLLK